MVKKREEECHLKEAVKVLFVVDIFMSLTPVRDDESGIAYKAM